jgi:hypothetical protein
VLARSWRDGGGAGRGLRAGHAGAAGQPAHADRDHGLDAFIAETTRVPSFAWVDWSGRLEVPVTTLDALIEAHGEPAFAKIDVEGMEHEVLAGLSRPLRALSFEFVPSSMSSALASLERLEALGRYRFEVSLGEEMRLRPRPVGGRADDAGWLTTREPEGTRATSTRCWRLSRRRRQEQQVPVADQELGRSGQEVLLAAVAPSAESLGAVGLDRLRRPGVATEQLALDLGVVHAEAQCSRPC